MSLGMPIAFGSDVNGMANLPRPPWVGYRAALDRSTTRLPQGEQLRYAGEVHRTALSLGDQRKGVIEAACLFRGPLPHAMRSSRSISWVGT